MSLLICICTLYPSVCLHIYLLICLYVSCLFTCMSICSSICLVFNLSGHLSTSRTRNKMIMVMIVTYKRGQIVYNYCNSFVYFIKLLFLPSAMGNPHTNVHHNTPVTCFILSITNFHHKPNLN